jgi:stage III sporulation protein AH
MTIVVLERRRLARFGLLVLLCAAGAAFVARNLGALEPSGARPAAGPSGAVAVAAPPRSGGAASPAGYFAAARLQRDQAESRELSQLEALAREPGASTAVRAEAQEQILQLEQMQEEEAQAELVLGAKGFPQSLVLLHPGGATVVVQAAGFDAAAAARVAQAVASVASLDPADVQIVVHGSASG